MIQHASFLVFAPNPWHDLWRNRQQIFSRLAGPNRVLYVEPARTALRDWRQRRISPADLRRPAVIEQQPNLWLYRIPAWLPTRGSGGRFDRIADRLLAYHLRRTLRRHLPPRPVLWLYRPTQWRWAATNFAHSLLVYHVTDDYTAYGHLGPAERQALARAEEELLAAADLTLVTAPRLLALKQRHARRIELVPNGVDFDAFRRALAAPPLPLHSSGDPLIGCSGHISGRLDLPLLRELALARPAWQFLFAGSEDAAGCQPELDALKALPNVHLLGLLPVEQVPGFIAACDLCLVPYRINDETRAISSLRLYEYLAAGKPVVSAAVPAATEHAAVVGVADATAASWLEAIEAGLATADDPTAVAARQAVAAANTWDARVEAISRHLTEGLAEA